MQFVEPCFSWQQFKRMGEIGLVGGITDRIGRSYVKSKRKQKFVIVTIYAFLLTIILFCTLRGSLYIVLVTLLVSVVFELVAYLLLGLLSKMGLLVKLLSLSVLFLAAVIFTMLSNKHGYVGLSSLSNGLGSL